MLGVELMDWLLTFAESAGEKPGCFPDPYLRAKGKFHLELFPMVPVAIAHRSCFFSLSQAINYGRLGPPTISMDMTRRTSGFR